MVIVSLPCRVEAKNASIFCDYVDLRAFYGSDGERAACA